MFDIGVPPCALRLLVSYLQGRCMQVHLKNAVSLVFDLWGGGPQGGLMTVLLFNVNSNWITDVCQPGLRQSSHFLESGMTSRPRDTWEQGRDCPPEFVWPHTKLGHHTCPYSPPCRHATPPPPTPSLSPLALPFFPTSHLSVDLDATCVSHCNLPVVDGALPVSPLPSASPALACEVDAISDPTPSFTCLTAVPKPLANSLDICDVDGSNAPTAPSSHPAQFLYCIPILDHDGLCHCSQQPTKPHSPYLGVLKFCSYPPCRE